MPDKTLCILIDMDAIITDLTGKVLKVFNSEYGTDVQKKDIDREEFTDCLTKFDVKTCLCGHSEARHAAGCCVCLRFRPKPIITIEEFRRQYMDAPGFFSDLMPLPGALEAVKLFHDEGHEVVIATSQSNEHCAFDKYRWLNKHLPFLDRKDVLMGHKKWKIRGDIFIDDYPRNIKQYRQHWPDSVIMTIQYPYNAGLSDLVDVMAQSYQDTYKAWQTIAEQVDLVCTGDFVSGRVMDGKPIQQNQ